MQSYHSSDEERFSRFLKLQLTVQRNFSRSSRAGPRPTSSTPRAPLPTLRHYFYIFSQKTLVFCGSQISSTRKASKSPSNDPFRLTVREPGPESHEPDRNDRTVLQKLRIGPQVSPNTTPDEPARAHLDSCGRRAGASPHRPQPPSRAQGSSEEQPRMHHNAPGCTRMYQDA